MRRGPTARAVNVGVAVGVGLLLLAGITAGLLLLLASGSNDGVGVLVVLPALVLLSLPILARRASLDRDPKLFWLLLFALLLKMGGAFLRYYVTFSVYEGAADAAGYHVFGQQIADAFSHGNFDSGLGSLSGTDFIRFLTGIIYTATGPTRLGGFLVFSWLGFWGLYFFYRAFTIAVPEGRARSYGYLVFFLPSLLFWPSSIGKESWMILSLGIAALGAARLMTGKLLRGLVVTAAGMWAASLVRPHVAGLVAVSLAAAYLVRPARRERGYTPLAKAVGLASLVAVALVLVQRTDRFLERSAIETREGLTSVLEETRERTSVGGSRFAPSILESPLRTPVAVATILFRPFIFEADNLQTLAAALETTFLLVLAVKRYRWVLAAALSIRRQPFVAFALAYAGAFIFAFSGIANFGLLARERVQLLPFIAVLLSIPPRSGRSRSDESDEYSRATV